VDAFIYDKTFDGLLSCVFAAYAGGVFPERLLPAAGPIPLFIDSTYNITTEVAKAARVWTGLEKKLTSQVCGMLIHVWLSEREGSDELLFRYIRKAFDRPAGYATDFTDTEVIRVYKIAGQVGREMQRLIQFVRFQKAADGVFFAPVSPDCNALPLTVDHFTDRFTDQRWLIYDVRRRYGYYYDMRSASEVTIEHDSHLIDGRLSEALLSGDELLFQEMWREYTISLTIRERLNPRLQRQQMPTRFRKYMPETATVTAVTDRFY
jgi:probable DNA metabolism protein